MARLLRLHEGGVHCHGGAALEQLASRGDGSANARYMLGIHTPLTRRPGCDFSFSGLKTSVRAAVLGGKGGGHSAPLVDVGIEKDRANVAAAFQAAAFDHLLRQTVRAMEWCDEHRPDTRTLVVCGGVAANHELRSQLRKLTNGRGWDTLFPPAHLCTDNGIMVAWAGLETLKERGLGASFPWPGGEKLCLPRWSIETPAG